MIELDFQFQTTQINLYCCDHPFMNDTVKMDEFLEELVNFIDMNKIPKKLMGRDNPHSIDFKPDYLANSEWGVTGNIIMAESHIHAHSFPNKKGFCNIVITSCKPYDSDEALLWILKYTNATVYRMETMKF